MDIDVIQVLRFKASEAGSQRALAEQLGVGQPYLSRVMSGRLDPGPSILDPLGLERVVSYRAKRPAEEAAA